jgi:hypothetical protein
VESGRGNESEDILRRLEERLERASDVAERLVAEVAAEASATVAGLSDRVKAPPAGWQVRSDPDADSRTAPEGDPERVLALLHGLRELIPPELQQRVAEALRQLLLAVRALVDWYLERLEQKRSEPAKVQDIPIL